MIAYCSRAEHTTEVGPEPIVKELITLLHTPDRTEKQFLYQKDGKGLGHGELSDL
jgi:hypothetical protein